MRNVADGDKHVVVLNKMTNFLCARNILRRKHGDDAFHCFCGGSIDGEHLCARIRTAHARAKQHAGQMDIVRVLSRSERFIDDFDSTNAIANRSGKFGFRHFGVFTKEFCAEQDRVFDLFISGTAANVVFDGFFHIRMCWLRILINESLRADDHARRAKAALNRARGSKRIGIYILFARSKTFDGDD